MWDEDQREQRGDECRRAYADDAERATERIARSGRQPLCNGSRLSIATARDLTPAGGQRARRAPETRRTESGYHAPAACGHYWTVTWPFMPSARCGVQLKRIHARGDTRKRDCVGVIGCNEQRAAEHTELRRGPGPRLCWHVGIELSLPTRQGRC